MCGIAGLYDLHGTGRERDPGDRARAMVDTLAHRGPDGAGHWGDPAAGIGFGHRRLAIVDLSPGGAQPMHSADGRYVITYNGEVYNFGELHAELSVRGHNFKSTSDTEVMLAAIVAWGLEEAVRRFVGMFAFALFDRQTRTLHLVRDRLGVKPLYWTMADGMLLFGSELRALTAHPAFVGDIDREAVMALLRYSYIPAPATIYRGVFKLPAGSILTVPPGGTPSIAPYWRLADVVARHGQNRLSFEDATTALDVLLRDCVARRLVADVPVGAFLSGGTDSAAIVAMMQAVSERPARTFTIGFRDAAYDESQAARTVAEHLKTDHTEIMIEPDAALALVSDVADWFDEPFADSSQLPTYLVSRMTRRHVSVALSGDGGDEMFAGYPKYRWLERVWQTAGHLPPGLRACLGQALRAAPDAALRRAAALVLEPGRAERIGEKARRLGAALSAPDVGAAARALDVVGVDDIALVPDAQGTLHPPHLGGLEALPDLVSRMQAQDMATYLPDDILTKVDRCSMAVALEAREPLLDHRLVEFVWSLPAPVRRRPGPPKGLLRAVLQRYLPRDMLDRPKRGFSIPLDQWLAGPLRGWADDLLSVDAVSKEGILDARAVDTLWKRHLSGAQRNSTAIWNILMMRAWSMRWQNR
ncbi:MAG: asparagine synthetase B [Alphaproteobacteria bacterium]|nr:MAG: asparagine synthetase B [Alphaproteobacteria bacterium]